MATASKRIFVHRHGKAHAFDVGDFVPPELAVLVGRPGLLADGAVPDPEPVPTVSGGSVVVPDGTVSEVLEWISDGGDPDGVRLRAAEALSVEQLKSKPRAGVVNAAASILGGDSEAE